MRLPTLFVSHGSPMLAIEPGEIGPRLSAWSAALPRPRAILVASPHWMSAQPLVSGLGRPAILHDFGGFPPALYQLDYPAPTSAELGEEVAELLRAAGLPAQVTERGLDHGAWVPLRYLYPKADIPVLQLSLHPAMGPREQLALGRALAPLRENGWLLIGSGSITHNLYEFRGAQTERAPHVEAFMGWVQQTLADGDLPTLLEIRSRAPHFARNHPTDEHLTPLFFALGAAGEDWRNLRLLPGGISYGVLGMDAYAFGEAQPAAA